MGGGLSDVFRPSFQDWELMLIEPDSLLNCSRLVWTGSILGQRRPLVSLTTNDRSPALNTPGVVRGHSGEPGCFGVATALRRSQRGCLEPVLRICVDPGYVPDPHCWHACPTFLGDRPAPGGGTAGQRTRRTLHVQVERLRRPPCGRNLDTEPLAVRSCRPAATPREEGRASYPPSSDPEKI